MLCRLLGKARAHVVGCAAVLILAQFVLMAAAAQSDPWHIHSPRPGQLIADGQLFVVVSLEAEHELDAKSVQVLLDGRDLSRDVRVRDGRITLLHLQPLGTGTHQVRLTAADVVGTALPVLAWQFEVESQAGAVRAATGGTAGSVPLGFEVSGFSAADARGSHFDGPGQDLRQEPLSSQALTVDARGRYRNVELPVKLHLTSDEASGLQPRNRVQAGLRTEHLTLFVGDNTPSFGELVMSGARTRGLQVRAEAGPVALSVVRGDLQRGIEGRFTVNRPGGGIPADTAAFMPGTFRRGLTAVRLSVGSENSVLFGLHGLKARDDLSSIQLGRDPKENLVVGTDLAMQLWRGRLRLEGGGALSVTTDDISRGPLTKAELDSLADIDAPFDPADFERIITLNASTIPMGPAQIPSALAWHLGGTAALGVHQLEATYQSVGAAFISFGNPFLQTDRQTFTVSDRFQLWQGRLSGNVRYRHYGTPPSTSNPVALLNADMVSGTVSVVPVPRGPRVHLGYRYHGRDRSDGETGVSLSESRTHSYTAGGFHQLRTGGFQHGLSLFWTYSDRTDQVRANTGNTTQTVSAGLNEQLPIPLNLNLQLSWIALDSEALGPLQRLTTFTGKATYRFAEQGVTLSAAVRNAHAQATSFAPTSDRFTFNAGGTYRVFRQMTVELQAGISTYREVGVPQNRYTEQFVTLRHRYSF